MNLPKKEKKRLAKNLTLVTLGTMVLAFGTAVFIIPFELVTGGVSGFSIVISHALGGALSVELLIAALTWGLFFLGLLLLGRDFALKTLLSTFIYPLGISLFGELVRADVFDGFFMLADSAHGQIAILLSAVFGGLLVGAGCALTFLGGGSTGGVDIIAFIIRKYWGRGKSSAVIFALDAAAVLLGVFVIKDMVLTLLGITSAFISALAVEHIWGKSGN